MREMAAAAAWDARQIRENRRVTLVEEEEKALEFAPLGRRVSRNPLCHFQFGTLKPVRRGWAHSAVSERLVKGLERHAETMFLQ